MVLDPRILLGAQFPDRQGATANVLQNFQRLQNLQAQPQRNQLFEQQIAQGQQALDQGEAVGRETQRKEAAFALRAIKPFIDVGDLQGAGNLLSTLDVSDELKAGLAGELQGDQAVVKMNLDSELAALDKSFKKTPTQFGAQATFKDSKGNLFFGTTKRDPGTGEVKAVLAAVDGSDKQPIGKVEQTGSFGQTAAEKVVQKGKEAGATEAGKLDVKLEKEPTLAGKTDAAKAAIKLSTESFKRLEPLQQNLANIDDAIRLIDEGAETGPIISRLPSIRKSSIELDTLQKKLGLDVIASTTFGALSEGEREFALSTALPKNLQGPDLKRWLQRKRLTQEKLINQLSEAASFLGTPGNTIADYIELKKLEELDQQEQETQTEEVQAQGADDQGTFEINGVQIRKVR